MNSRTPTTTTRRRLLATGLVVVALLLSLVAAATFSAFSATTGNSGNNASAGTVSLTDNDSSAAIFNLAGMIPGDTDSGCIQVTYTGSVPALVRLYGAPPPAPASTRTWT